MTPQFFRHPEHAMHFADRLAEALDRTGAPACVGLDPVIEKIPQASLDATAGEGGDDVEAIGDFCVGVLHAVHDAGIKRIKVTHTAGGLEVDHVQYGR